VNSGHASVSVARMVSPSGWQEPGQRPEFEEITVVLKGSLRVEYEGGVVDVPAGQMNGLVDRLMWTDDALHRLHRMPPYLAPLFQDEIEQDLRARGERVATYDGLLRPRSSARIEWDPDAERRLNNVPAPVRAMAKIELERTAADRGSGRITVALMEEVKAKYFGLGAKD